MTSAAFPRVRRNLRYVRQVQDGTPVWVVKDPISLKYYRFGDVEGWLMQQMDGTRSLAEIAGRLRVERGIAATDQTLDPFHRRLRELGLAERSQEERSVLIMEAVRQQRHSRLRGDGNTLTRMRFSLGDPDRLFTRMVERLGFFWTPGFVVFSLALFAVYALIVATHWDALVRGTAMLLTPTEYTLGLAVTLYATLAVITVIHEFGHGLTCKRFGGEVHEIGALMLYFSPGMYCNVNDAWTFERRGHRLWVTFAGGWIELVVAALAALVWIGTEPGTAVHQVAFVTMLTGGTLAVLLNFNPLIPLDGYFALMDWLEVPNLRARSFAYLAAAARRRFLGSDVPLPAVTPRERRIFLWYGTLAVLYTTTLLTVIALWAATLLIGWLGGWGWALVLFGVAAFGRRPLRRLGGMSRLRAGSTAASGRRRAVLASAALALLLGVIVPWPVRVSGTATVEPAQRTWLRPADVAWVDRVAVGEGAAVAAGDTVAVLRNPELELAWTRARAEAAAREREAAAARAAGDVARVRQADARLAAAREHAAELERRRGALVLRAPVAGRLATLRPEELVGTRVTPTDSLLELWADGPLHARVRLAERDAGRVVPGSPVGLKFPVRAEWTWRSRVNRVGPAAHDRQVDAIAPLAASGSPSGAEPLRPGMVGEARVVVRETHLVGALLDHLLHTLRLDWLL